MRINLKNIDTWQKEEYNEAVRQIKRLNRRFP